MPADGGSLNAPVAVCGAGAAGLAAAISAARAGAEVYLLEARPQVGGTVTHALIHTLAGLYDSAGEFINEGLALELATALSQADSAVCRRRMGKTWVLNVCPDVYRAVVQHWLNAERNIKVCTLTRVVEVACAGQRVNELLCASGDGMWRLRVRAVIDATGTAEVARMISPALVHDEERHAAGGLIFTLRGMQAGALEFPRGVGIVRAIRASAEEGRLSAQCGKAWIDAGVYPDEAYVKLFVPLPTSWRQNANHHQPPQSALDAQQEMIAFLRRLPEFADARLGRTGELGIREGGRVQGDYCLTAADVRQARKFSDAACRCCWPIEYWDADEGVRIEYLPERQYYEIPLRSLKLRGLENVWVAGKCLAADPLAQASARVVGCCWSMGDAVGKAAASN